MKKEKQLIISKEEAVKLYQDAPAQLKKILEDTFGKKELLPLKIEDKVKTFEDACKILGVSSKLPDVSTFPVENQKHFIAQHKIITIIKALNEGWKPNWSNSSEDKYYPYFYQSPSGFGFSGAYCDFWNASTSVGSRLCLKTEKLALYVGKQFEDIYKDIIL